MSVVSLFPSATEVAAALGATPVAVSHQCDRPPSVTDRPTLTGLVSELDADPESVERVVAYDDVYYVDGDALAAPDPDVVLTQGVCAVCALDERLARRAVERLELDATVLDVHADDLDDVLANVERIGEAVDRCDAATELRSELDARIEAVAGAVPVDAVPAAGAVSPDRSDPEGAARPRVAVFDWTDPLRHGGLWIPDLVEIAGGESGLAAAGERAGKVSAAAVREFDPEVIVVGPCGYDVAGAERAAANLLDRKSFEAVSAVRNGRVYAMDGTAYLNRHSHRVVDTLEALAAVIHPDRSGESDGRVRRVPVESAERGGTSDRPTEEGRSGSVTE
ncbi:iron complex transport system substrate-binding protein [Halorubrum alkaliphilum]|uniref:Iron complex transport system substrate-binding protein n=1 Tax=Halorubrum alkaliphilum TaxID=261290 RepID=A0A8T4GGY2_9EURY|nr:ABC transporter substrate-binding protein [Halorubrum alkaliphilum]MBP1922987.1 iron complex transport system substrate-binding protein [Halorubrum alkaliphilum]